MTRMTMAVACALVFGVTLTVMGQTSSIPRTPWGDPDLQGTYTNSNESGIAMEKPAEFAGKRQDPLWNVAEVWIPHQGNGYTP
jgi:hypothetical protein